MAGGRTIRLLMLVFMAVNLAAIKSGLSQRCADPVSLGAEHLYLAEGGSTVEAVRFDGPSPSVVRTHR